MKSKIGIIGLFVLIIQGCIPSLHALYTEDDLIEVDEILGHWSDEEGKEIWSFDKLRNQATESMTESEAAPDSHKGYFLTIKTNDMEEEFRIHFVKLGKHIYADFYPIKDDKLMSGFFSLHLVSAHSFARVRFEDGQLVLDMMDNDELKKAISQNRVRIKHEKTEQGIILTASTRELQRFVSKYGDLKESFESEYLLKRTTIHAK